PHGLKPAFLVTQRGRQLVIGEDSAHFSQIEDVDAQWDSVNQALNKPLILAQFLLSLLSLSDVTQCDRPFAEFAPGVTDWRARGVQPSVIAAERSDSEIRFERLHVGEGLLPCRSRRVVIVLMHKFHPALVARLLPGLSGQMLPPTGAAVRIAAGRVRNDDDVRGRANQ